MSACYNILKTFDLVVANVFIPLRKCNLKLLQFRASFQRMIFPIWHDFITNYHVWKNETNLYGNNYPIYIICVIRPILV